MPSRTGSAEKKPWTFLVYMAGDNNLEKAGVDDLAEMKKVGTQAGVNVLAQFDRPSGATRYLLQRNTSLARDAVAKLGKQNMGSPDALTDFIRWGVTAYPADRYALVLWNHGAGWDDTDIYANVRLQDARRPKHIRRAFFRTSVEKAAMLQSRGDDVARAILFDDGAKDFLDNLEMKAVLETTRKLIKKDLDLFGMDACLMSMVEVGYQSRSAVAFTVGSEETEPGEGWPYDAILRPLAAKPSMTGDELGRAVVDAYLRSYKGGNDAVTQSLCNLAGAPSVADAVKRLGAALAATLAVPAARSAINDARNRVQRYEVRDNVDLVDLCRLLGGLDGIPVDVKQAAQGVIDVVLSATARETYVVASGWVGNALKNSNGVAIYFPTEDVSPLYEKLDWDKATGWGTFLRAYIAATHGREAAPPPRKGRKPTVTVRRKAAPIEESKKKAAPHRRTEEYQALEVAHAEPPALEAEATPQVFEAMAYESEFGFVGGSGGGVTGGDVPAFHLTREEPEARPKPPAPEKTSAPPCHFQASMPQEVQVKTDATVEVVLSREVIAAAASRAAADGTGRVPEGSKLVVDLVPKRNFVAKHESRSEVVAPEADAPVELYFDVTATDVGEGEVWVVFRQGVQPLVTLKLHTEVVASAPSTRARKSADAPVDVSAPMAASAPNMLVIHERQNGAERRLTFELFSQQLDSTSQFESKAITGDRAAYVNAMYKSIEDAYATSKAEKKNFDQALRAYGATLWDELVPEKLQALLWAHRQTLDSILAFSEEPFIPWEIVHLKEPGKPLGEEVRFLGQMGLVRWLHGCGYPPSTLRLRKGRVRYVIPRYPDPDYVLPEVEKERAYIEKTFEGKPIEPQEGSVREALSHGGELDLVHFAGHAMADGGDIAHAKFMLEGSMASGRFVPDYITATVIGQFANLRGPTSRAMVVMNACQVGRVGFQLTSIGGFAPAFLGGGAGVFVSPLWSVGDRPASTFVLTLYDKLKAGKKLGAAVALARKAARNSGDATWLAYSVYGNPELKLG